MFKKGICPTSRCVVWLLMMSFISLLPFVGFAQQTRGLIAADGEWVHDGVTKGIFGPVQVHFGGGKVSSPPQRLKRLSPKVSVLSSTWTDVFRDDFEGSFPGSWQVSGNPTWGVETSRANSGTHSLWCAGSSRQPSEGYVDNMNAWATIGPFDLSTADEVEIEFAAWLAVESGYDFLRVAVSIDGATFSQVLSLTGNNPWQNYPVSLNAYAGSSTVWVAFRFTSDGSVTGEGAYIDDVVLRARQRPPVDMTITSHNEAGFPRIEVYARVLDDTLQPIPGLDESHFQVIEIHPSAGTQAPPFQVQELEAQGPIAVCLVMDSSGSMQEEIADAKQAAHTFIDQMDALDRVAIIDQNEVSNVRVIANFTSDKSVLHAAIDSLVADGSNTPLYDAMMLGVDTTAPEVGNKAVISLTDGKVNAGTTDRQAPVARAQVAGLPIFTIGLGAEVQEADLRYIAEETGGDYYFEPDAGAISGIYQAIKSTLQRQYLIAFNSPHPNLDGTTRHVDVEVTFGNHSDVDGFDYTVAAPLIIQRTPETIQWSETPQPSGVAIAIAAEISGGSGPLSASLFYRPSGSLSYTTLSMTNVSGTLFRAEIPATAVQAPGLHYYLTASDGVQSVSDPPQDAANHPYSIPVEPNEPPAITHTPVTTAFVGTPVSIGATVMDGTNRVAAVQLAYRRSDLPLFTFVEMVSAGGDEYATDIPGTDVTTVGVDYYLIATDDFGLTSTHGSASSPHHIQVVASDEGNYFVVNPLWAGQEVRVISLTDGNTIRAGAFTTTLNRYEAGTLPGREVYPGLPILTDGPMEGFSVQDGTDAIPPASLAGERFVIPQVAGEHLYDLLSPTQPATVTLQNGDSQQTVTLLPGILQTLNMGNANTRATTLRADHPILVHHRTADGKQTFNVAPASTEVYGVYSSHYVVAALEEQTQLIILSSNGQKRVIRLNSGEQRADIIGKSGAQGLGDAITVKADKPVAAIQYGDGDGDEATMFLPDALLGHVYVWPEAQYLAIVMPHPHTELKVILSSTVTSVANPAPKLVSQSTLPGFPGKAYLGSPTNGVSIPPGFRLEANKPIFVMAEKVTSNDEQNLYGMRQEFPSFVLALYKGLNYISVPLQQENMTISGLADFIGDVAFISVFDPTTQRFVTYTPGVASPIAERPVTGETGYFVSLNVGKVVRFSGPAWPGAIHLQAGLNAIALPVNPGPMLTSEFAELVGSPYVQWWDAQHQQLMGYWVGAPFSLDGPVEGGRGYLVTSIAAKDIPLTGEGWENIGVNATPAGPLQSERAFATPLLVLTGEVVDEKNRPLVARIDVQGPQAVSARTQTTSGQYVLTLSTQPMRPLFSAGDEFHLSITTASGASTVDWVYTLTAEDIQRHLVRLPSVKWEPPVTQSALLPNFPNPFNPETWIPYRLAAPSDVILTIYDANGHMIRRFDLGSQPAGRYESTQKAVHWDGKNATGEKVSSGLYFYELKAGDFKATRKLVVLK